MVDYAYYQNNYYGTKITSSNDFNRLSDRASRYLDKRLTAYEIDGVLYEVLIDDTYKKCICELVDAMFNDENYLKSETVGSWRKEYADKNIYKLRQIVLDYYGGTGLLYRGDRI